MSVYDCEMHDGALGHSLASARADSTSLEHWRGGDLIPRNTQKEREREGSREKKY